MQVHGASAEFWEETGLQKWVWALWGSHSNFAWKEDTTFTKGFVRNGHTIVVGRKLEPKRLAKFFFVRWSHAPWWQNGYGCLMETDEGPERLFRWWETNWREVYWFVRTSPFPIQTRTIGRLSGALLGVCIAKLTFPNSSLSTFFS